MQRFSISENVKKAERMQDSVFKKMTAGKKIKLVGQFFELGKDLQKLNDRKRDGNNNPTC